MSSFANLFGKSTKIDESVDQLFKSSSDGPVSKDKLTHKKVTVIDVPESTHKHAAKDNGSSDEEEESIDEEDVEEEEEDVEEEEEKVVKKSKKSKKKDDNEDLESKYFNKLLNEDEKYEKKEDKENESSEEDKPEKASEETKKAKAATTIDLKEAELEKAERTIFVGNVPSEIITSKPMEKSFKKLFKHYGKIESIRYRSISFDENLPRKVAFAKKNLHKSRDSVNAYIVFKDKQASKAAKELNATVFEDHHLRVDHVAHPAPKDNKRTIFVGNLDFEEREETLWKYFNSKLDNDVESVRVIRDSKTNMGKGFALVQFKDTLSVNKALLLNDKPLETNSDKKGRKLRISRAKSTAKPSLMSPNHFDNQKKKYAANKAQQKLNESQKTKLGRAQSVLGKADKSTVKLKNQE
ncbi:Nucleolar protein 12 [Candida maltosa Xu316]|uniref:Nucleolar protein 12 n=1 Tax=Candida maltosa (strain Xu316) TaxID=1245528 RepID=M3JF37_CANMX|nr:Nucleolar protein 12 [Candida maltosa Xu316]